MVKIDKKKRLLFSTCARRWRALRRPARRERLSWSRRRVALLRRWMRVVVVTKPNAPKMNGRDADQPKTRCDRVIAKNENWREKIRETNDI